MECQYCKKILSTKGALTTHQKRTRYCLKIQGKSDTKGAYNCDLCGKNFFNHSAYKYHQTTKCKLNTQYSKITEMLEITEEKLVNKTEECIGLHKEIEVLRSVVEQFRSDYKELSITAVKRPTTSTKNVQINNYIKNMPPLLESDINNNVQNLTLEHHAKGAEGYAEYALEFPFKDKIVCVDTSRNKIKYKNEDGDVIEDVGFRKMMIKLCTSLKDRSFNLSQEHYEKLSDTFTEKEVDDYNFMEAAIAISKFANGRESDFCNQMVKMISKKSSR